MKKGISFILSCILILSCVSCAGTTETVEESATEPVSILPTSGETETETETEDAMPEGKKKAAVYILLGQSNAVGHRLNMSTADKIDTPLENVFGLNRNLNQSFSGEKLFWKGYTSDGMNLAETQDHTYSVANCLAQDWQDAIDGGEDLPDLYIIHIAIGAQGVSRKYMWNPDREEQLIPGKLGTVKISLYPYAIHFFSMLRDSFEEKGLEPDFLGIHWMGGENDFTVDQDEVKREIKGIYDQIFQGFWTALGERVPTVLYRLNCPDRCNDMDSSGTYLETMQYINTVFEDLSQQYQNISIFDTRNSPDFVEGVRGNGIFGSDCVHYTAGVMQWIAEGILNDYIETRTES